MGKRITDSLKKTKDSTNDLSKLSDFYDKFKNENEDEVDDKMSTASIEPFDIPTEFIGFSKIVENASEKCFLNPFSQNDIIFFQKRLANPLFRNQRLFLEKQRLLEQILSSWLQSKKGKSVNPLEPFLYALKLSDGIVGSASNVANPNPNQLETFASALLPYWDVNSKEDTRLICHILVNWDWYQPLLVVIKMYQLKAPYINEDIDEILRLRKLFTPDYATVTFECLSCHISKYNTETLLDFVSRSHQISIVTSSEIQVTKRMRDLFEKMYNYAPTEIQGMLKKLYCDKYRAYADTKSRHFLDDVIGISPPPDDIYEHFRRYKDSSGDEKQQHYDYIVKNWNLAENGHQKLCRQIPDENILDLMKRKLQNVNGSAYGAVLFNLAENHYSKAQKFVKEEYEKTSLQNRQWVACACALNHMSNKPQMAEIAEQFFIYGRGYLYKRQLQWLTRDSQKSKQLREAVCNLHKDIAEKPNKWGIFIQSCYEFYSGEYGITNYPIEIDQLLKKSIPYYASNYPNLIYDVLKVIENMMNRNNRNRYRDMLHEIYYQESFSDIVHTHARRLLDKFYLE